MHNDLDSVGFDCSGEPTMGLSKKGKPCIEFRALVAAVTSANTIHAWPRSRYVFMHTTSRILPNWEKIVYRHFFSSAVSPAPHVSKNFHVRSLDGCAALSKLA